MKDKNYILTPGRELYRADEQFLNTNAVIACLILFYIGILDYYVKRVIIFIRLFTLSTLYFLGMYL